MLSPSHRCPALCSRHLRRWLLGLCLLLLCVPTLADPSAPATADFRKGVLYGKVVDVVTGKPIADAVVALQDKNGKVITWSKTNAQGEYALAADPMTALAMRPSRRRGLLEQVCRAVGNVVTAPAKIIGSAVANPGQTLGAAAVSAASGIPAPLAAEAAGPVLADPAGQQARQAAAQTTVDSLSKGKSVTRDCGAARIMVSAPNYKGLQGGADAYWLEPPRTTGKDVCGLQAWLETAQLAPASSDKPSAIAQEALRLTDPQVDPSLAPAGATLKIRVKLQAPSGPPHAVRVFAREARKNVVVELMPGTGADSSLFSGTLTLDPKTPIGETMITLAALRAEPVEVKLDKNKPDPLAQFVGRLDAMQPDKPYEYDPRIMASANRLDVKIAVIDPKQGTPAPAATPSAPNTPPAGKK